MFFGLESLLPQKQRESGKTLGHDYDTSIKCVDRLYVRIHCKPADQAIGPEFVAHFDKPGEIGSTASSGQLVHLQCRHKPSLDRRLLLILRQSG
jgi:hypothetical protein